METLILFAGRLSPKLAWVRDFVAMGLLCQAFVPRCGGGWFRDLETLHHLAWARATVLSIRRLLAKPLAATYPNNNLGGMRHGSRVARVIGGGQFTFRRRAETLEPPPRPSPPCDNTTSCCSLRRLDWIGLPSHSTPRPRATGPDSTLGGGGASVLLSHLHTTPKHTATGAHT
jgi:hypothetical protein